MSKMRVTQVTRPNGAFEIVEREIPEPGAGLVRIKAGHGVCHSRVFTKEGKWPGIQYRGFQDMRHAALDVNIPNYANAIMPTTEIVASIASLQAVAAVLYLERRTTLVERIVLFRWTEGAIDNAAG